MDTSGPHEVQDVSIEEHDSSTADNEESDLNDTESQQISPNLRVDFRRLMNSIDSAISATIAGHENNRNGNTSDTDVSMDSEPISDTHRRNNSGSHKKRKICRWIPPSYLYKEEMRRILSEELRLGSALIRSVITL
ncbi:unnamed protein product [Trichobilharzia regenti]|nr:unnamed protein product [Trichobilharzia regenti]